MSEEGLSDRVWLWGTGLMTGTFWTDAMYLIDTPPTNYFWWVAITLIGLVVFSYASYKEVYVKSGSE